MASAKNENGKSNPCCSLYLYRVLPQRRWPKPRAGALGDLMSKRPANRTIMNHPYSVLRVPLEVQSALGRACRLSTSFTTSPLLVPGRAWFLPSFPTLKLFFRYQTHCIRPTSAKAAPQFLLPSLPFFLRSCQRGERDASTTTGVGVPRRKKEPAILASLVNRHLAFSSPFPLLLFFPIHLFFTVLSLSIPFRVRSSAIESS